MSAARANLRVLPAPRAAPADDVRRRAAAVAALASMPDGGVGVLLGIGGSGKSTIAQAVADRWRRRVVFDAYAQVDRRRADGKRHTWRGRLVEVRELRARPELLDADPLALVVYSERGVYDDARAGQDFALCAQLVMATGGVDLIAEEAGRYGRHAHEAVNMLASGSGHFGGRLLLIAQRPMRVTADARDAVSVVVAGAQGRGAGGLAALAELTDTDFAARVRALRAACAPSCALDHAHLRVPDAPHTWRLGAAAEER